MTLRGNVAELRKIARAIERLPKQAAERIAERVAPALTSDLAGNFGAGNTVWGDARPQGVNGNALDLVQSGRTRGDMAFRAAGRRVTVALSAPYARYLIGKYEILPRTRIIPLSWGHALDAASAVEIKVQLP